MKFGKRGFRAMAFGLVAVAGLAFASAASARDHFSLGISVPGLTVGVGNHHTYVGVGGGYYGGGYYSPGYGPAYYAAPAPVYYAPAPVYYGPAYYGGYYSRPVYRGGYYGHGYYRDGYRGGYYNRGGYYHH